MKNESIKLDAVQFYMLLRSVLIFHLFNLNSMKQLISKVIQELKKTIIILTPLKTHWSLVAVS